MSEFRISPLNIRNRVSRFQNPSHKLYKFSIIKNLRILFKNRSEGYQLPTENVHLRDLEQKRWDGFRDFRNLHFRIHEYFEFWLFEDAEFQNSEFENAQISVSQFSF